MGADAAGPSELQADVAERPSFAAEEAPLSYAGEVEPHAPEPGPLFHESFACWTLLAVAVGA